jgi:hypothetical protein
MPISELTFQSGDPVVPLSRPGPHDLKSKTRDKSVAKPWALTAGGRDSLKEIWGITKKEKMLGRQNTNMHISGLPRR